MKTRTLVCLLHCALWLGATPLAQAQGPTAFTYQGRLMEAGSPANGDYDLQFTLYNALSDGAGVGIPTTNRPVGVSNGLFSVILDFGADAFDGSPRWLQLGVRTNGSAADYFPLSLRQFISVVPYSITALNLAGTVPGGGLAGTYTNALAFGNPVNSFVGNVAGAASTATNFTGLLNGDVAGPQSATVVASVGGQSAANVAIGATAANNATAANVPGTIVKRNASGNLTAGAVNATTLSGDGAGVTNLHAGSVATGTLADARLSANVPLLNGTNAFGGDNTFSGSLTATNANNIVKGAFTGNLTGNVQGNLIGAASTATNFSGALGGDVTGQQGATVVASVGGQSAANVASGVIAANGASVVNVPGAVVKRDMSGNFAAGSITATSLNGDGAGVNNLNASSVAFGTLTDARLSGNVPLLNGNQSFTGVNTFGNAGNSFAGSFAGEGAGLTNLNGASIVSGTVGNAQLAANSVQTANIVAGSVGNTQLASGAAVANLMASGQSGVASGGVIFSRNPTSSNLVNAGYVRIGKTVLGVDMWERRADMPLAGRDYHTAVWTGTEMIVWGGWGGGYLNTGGRYIPSSDTWQSTTTAGAAPGRHLSNSVWTGAELIVSGGEVNSPWYFFNDTFIYTPPTTLYLFLKP